MSFYAYTALWLTYTADRVLLPDPLIFRITLQDPLLAFDQTFIPSELIFRTQLTESLILTVTPIVFTPDPLIFRITLQDPLLAYLQTFTPDPLIFRAAFQVPTLIAGDTILLPDPLLFLVKMTAPAILLGGLYPLLSADAPFVTQQIFMATLHSDTGSLTMPAQSINATLRPALATPNSIQVPASKRPSVSLIIEQSANLHTQTGQENAARSSNKGTWRYYNPAIPETAINESSFDRTQKGGEISTYRRYFKRHERGNQVETDEQVYILGYNAQGVRTASQLRTQARSSSYHQSIVSGPLTISFNVSSQLQIRQGTDQAGNTINETTTDRDYSNSFSQEIPIGGPIPPPVVPPSTVEQDDELQKIPASNRNDCSVVVPGAATYLASIVALIAGGHPEIAVTRRSIYSTGDALDEVLFSMSITGWNLSKSDKMLLTIRGTGVSSPSKADTIDLAQVIDWQKDSTGSYQIHAPLDPLVQPGDLVTYAPDALSIGVQEIRYAISVGAVSMTVQGR